MNTFGKRLAAERIRLTLTQEDLRDRLGVGKVTQIKYESDATSPNAEYIAGLVREGFDVMFLLTGNRSLEALSIEHRNLLDAYDDAPTDVQRAAFAVLVARFIGEVEKAQQLPGYFANEIKYGNDLSKVRAAAVLKRYEVKSSGSKSASLVKKDKAS